MATKPYRQVQIQECRELLVPIPADFALVQPHPYLSLGAPYGNQSPFFVRQGVCDRLKLAQSHLQQLQPDWKLLIFDAFRPLAVQQFMVDYTFAELVRQERLILEELTDAQRQELYDRVYEFWALPDPDPGCPPPHSTGGAVDVTVVDGTEHPIAMGSAIDEVSPRSYPNYFANSKIKLEQDFHRHRQALYQAMTVAGLKRHPNEWWHFSYGDQLWAWLVNQETPDRPAIACYGRVMD